MSNTRGLTVKPGVPHGMPVLPAASARLSGRARADPVVRLVEMLRGAHGGDVVIVTDQTGLGGTGKTHTIASALHIEEVRSYFSSIFWVNLSAYKTEEELFGAVRILAVDVYFTLRNLISSIAKESESLIFFNDIAKTLLDLDSLESAENAIRSLIACTNLFLTRRGYTKCTPLLVLDSLWNNRLLLLFRETGFVVVVTTRRYDLVDDGSFPGCSLILEPLRPQEAFNVIGSRDLSIDSDDIPYAIKNLCSEYSTVAELAVLGSAALMNEDANALLQVCLKRQSFLESETIRNEMARHDDNPFFNNSLLDHRSTIVSLMCAFDNLGLATAQKYMSLISIPQGAIFDTNFVLSLWDLSKSSTVEVQSMLNAFAMLNLLVKVVIPPAWSMLDLPNPSGPARLDSRSDYTWKSTAFVAQYTVDFPDNNTFYMLSPLHADFLLFLALCSLDQVGKGGGADGQSWTSWLSFGGSKDAKSLCLDRPSALLERIRPSCESTANFLASKSLLMSLESIQYFLYSAYWRRLESMKTLELWVPNDSKERSDPCAVYYMRRRLMTEMELEGENSCIQLLSRACEVLEKLEGQAHYYVLSRWYERLIMFLSRQTGDDTNLLDKAQAMNALGKLYCRTGDPERALDLHRQSLEIYRQVSSSSMSNSSAPAWKGVAAQRGVISVLENMAYALNLRVKTATSENNAVQISSWKAEALEFQKTAVKLKLVQYGSTNVGLAVSRACLADLLLAHGFFEEAVVEFKQALDVFALRLGTNHRIYNSCRANYGVALAGVSANRDQYRKAIELIQESVVWFLRHGMKWDDPQIMKLRSQLPPDVVAAMESSGEVQKLIEKPPKYMFLW